MQPEQEIEPIHRVEVDLVAQRPVVAQFVLFNLGRDGLGGRSKPPFGFRLRSWRATSLQFFGMLQQLAQFKQEEGAAMAVGTR